MDFNDRNGPSKRQLPDGMASAIAATVAPSNQAVSAKAAVPSLQHPAEKYIKPPFPSQSQPWPGLASNITGQIYGASGGRGNP
jgi:hypothetical protein